MPTADPEQVKLRQSARDLLQPVIDEDARLQAIASDLQYANSLKRQSSKTIARLLRGAADLEAQSAELARQAAALRTEAAETEADADRLDAHAQELEQAKCAAETRRRAADDVHRARTDMHPYLNAGIPAAELPGDVLGCILALAREHDAPRASRTLFALTAAQVCRAWRHIALATGALWAWIHVDGSGPALRTLEGASVFLARSQPYLLDVLVGTAQDDILRALLDQAPRIRAFRTTRQSGKRIRRLLRLFSVPAPRLEVLDIRCSSTMPWTRPPITAFPQSPHLSSLTLQGVPSYSLDLPAAQIREFACFLPRLADDYDYRVLADCRRFPSLEHITLHFGDSGETAHVYVDRESIPNGLAVSAMNKSQAALSVIHVLAAIPEDMRSSIVSLSLSNLPLYEINPQQLGTRYLPGLETLTLAGVPMQRSWKNRYHLGYFIDAIAVLRSLTRLVVTGNSVHRILSAFTADDQVFRSSSDPAVPSLHTLAIPPCRKAHRDGACSYGSLVYDAVAARQRTGMPISVLEVDAAYVEAAAAHSIEWLRAQLRLEVV